MFDATTTDPTAKLIEELGETRHPLKRRLAVIFAAKTLLSQLGYDDDTGVLNSAACDLDDAIFSEEHGHPGHNRWGEPYPRERQRRFHDAVASLTNTLKKGD